MAATIAVAYAANSAGVGIEIPKLAKAAATASA